MALTGLELLITIISVVSCIFSAVVIFTILFFKQLRKGHFFSIIMYMSVCDFCMNVLSAFGFPHDGSVLCWIQGSCQNYFAIASWFWTAMLSYKVFTVVSAGKYTLTWPTMYVIGWILPAIISALPLTTNNFGASATNTQWCLIVRRGNNPEWLTPFWSYMSFFVWLFVCIGLMIFWQVLIFMQFRRSMMKEVVKRTYDKLYWYPLVMIVCWTLNFACNDVDRNADEGIVAMSMIFGILDGFFTALIFMIKSDESRQRWMAYLFPKTRPRPLDNRPTLNYSTHEDGADYDVSESGGVRNTTTPSGGPSITHSNTMHSQQQPTFSDYYGDHEEESEIAGDFDIGDDENDTNGVGSQSSSGAQKDDNNHIVDNPML